MASRRRPALHAPPPPPPLQVYKPAKPRLRLLWWVGAGLAVVTLAAIIGAVQSLIDSWSHGFVLFE